VARKFTDYLGRVLTDCKEAAKSLLGTECDWEVVTQVNTCLKNINCALRICVQYEWMLYLNQRFLKNKQKSSKIVKENLNTPSVSYKTNLFSNHRLRP
jgi:hypothetical protein